MASALKNSSEGGTLGLKHKILNLFANHIRLCSIIQEALRGLFGLNKTRFPTKFFL